MENKTIPILPAPPSRERRRKAPKGRQVEPDALNEVRRLLGDKPRRRDLLIEHLHLIQDRYGRLSSAHLAALAQEMRMAQVEVYEVASFYHHFDVVKDDAGMAPAAAPVTVRVCDSLACDMAGAAELAERLPALLGKEARIVRVPCVGRCEQAPVAVVGQRALPSATPETVAAAARAGHTTPLVPDCNDYDAYRRQGGYTLLADCVAGRRSAESVMQAMEHSGLRGLGGAGFPAGRKWRVVAAERGPRLMAVNIDEGEPGTFKDRTFLERDPHRFLEGMLIAAWAVGIAEIYIYLRDEYHGCRAMLERELARLRAEPPMPGMPVLHLRRGAGAYICGEESAMIESIEGKRGMPRLRPPYVAQVGLFGRPTLEHNFETLYWVPEILQRGADWFASHGRRDRRGLRSFSVSGRVRHPGVHLAPAGITVQELIDEYCGGMQEGHRFYAYLPGGASGGILPASLNAIPLDFDTLQPYGCFIGSAAIIVLSDQDKAVAAARNIMKFFRDESCGQCTPCRVGTAKMLDLMQAPQWDRTLLAELSAVMRDASICGLGQAAPNPVDCVIRYFPHELNDEAGKP
ncbi:MAG TPA: NADH-ubiquinone oxidoreductase-F iron-sulfur binding region domain-containing protein [Noviherbaspirillum sp.]|uniref:NADH-ubiquinone oxidoreductase-F iron-sulfur binding region domain-containing protein n=1 Tax=Noviherbaspirillum sp. TaxID=1926288 RepID=UPI002D6F681E|nr:NADH-ubiquinone oxidoreductase-F iron-sulfur binding region domain-containing protein [Noviherbaspirillum sp.]HYD93960.1 NADH-ubiquinone oxidoreductase-F iron-sulfur binding region domain-containing protein [Noviherbaspirillum sp.]